MQNHIEVHTFGSKISQLTRLRGLDPYNLKDPSITSQLQTKRTQLLKQMISDQGNQQIKLIDVPIVHYDPRVFQDAREVRKTLHIREHADESAQAKHWRFRSKHRDITSSVMCYANGFGLTVKPFPIILTTGCAPNFMGSSSRDEATFLRNGKLKNPKHYENTLKLLFKRWLRVQDAKGTQILIVPLVGGGVYLKKVIDTAEAKDCIHRALRDALTEMKFSNIEEVVYSLPDADLDTNNPRRSKDYRMAEKIFSSYQNPNGPALSVANVDVLQAAGSCYHEGNKKVGLINPGSDRTIGGAFMSFKTTQQSSHVKITLEELICNFSNAAFIQSIDFNKNMIFLPYGEDLQLKKASYRDVGYKIAKLINSHNRIWISDVRNNKKISFKTHQEASRYASILSNQHQITSRQHPGKEKAIQRDGQYSVVYLRERQYDNFVSSLSHKL